LVKLFDRRRCPQTSDELPENILIESFMGCNLHCEMCPVPSADTLMNFRKPTAMTLSMFKLIVDQLSDKHRCLHLNQMGEPLLNPQIVEFVKYAKFKGHTVSLTTNGTLLNIGLAKNLIEFGLDEITISFDGAKKDTYEYIRKGALYENTLNNIDNLLYIIKNNRSNCKVKIDCILSDLTKLEKNQIEELWNGKNVKLNFLKLDNWGGQFNLPSEFGTKKTPESDESKISKRYPCDLLWTTLAISAEGRVMYCCHDYQLNSNLSSVNDKLLKNIWIDEINLERKRHINNVINSRPCLGCEAWLTRSKKIQVKRSLKDKIKNTLKRLVK
jgi:radical SAM protein with 4Fe4S-binding SPASM domain